MALEFTTTSTLSTPPSKADPANFASRADTFLGELPGFQSEINSIVTELNKITSGLDQAAPIAAWVVGTTYDFPDVVAGSDGYSYRCIDTAVVGENPTTDDGTYWIRISEAPFGNPGSANMVLTSTTAGVRSWISATLPTGAIMMMAVTQVPDGFLECDGSAISTSTYAALFAVLGSNYGPNPTTGMTFNLPDYRGRFIRGWDHGAGVDPDASSRTDRGSGTVGDWVGTRQDEAFKAHTHVHHRTGSGAYNAVVAATTTSTLTGNGSTTNSSGGTETRPINITAMFVIKY